MRQGNNRGVVFSFEYDEMQSRILKNCLKLLHWVYTTDPDSIDISDDYYIPRGERPVPTTLPEQKQYFGYLLKTEGRRGPVSILSTHIIQRIPEDEQLWVLIIIELSEADIYRRQGHITPVLNRTCSSLQQILNERLETELKLSPVIREAAEVNELTETELRLAQFVRHCRNDIAHNHPFDTEYSFWVHQHAAVAAIALLNSIRESWYGIDWYVENDLSPENCVKVVEMEFGFEWIPEEDTYDKHSLIKEYLHKGF